jgi:hypothetical protein
VLSLLLVLPFHYNMTRRFADRLLSFEVSEDVIQILGRKTLSNAGRKNERIGIGGLARATELSSVADQLIMMAESRHFLGIHSG